MVVGEIYSQSDGRRISKRVVGEVTKVLQEGWIFDHVLCCYFLGNCINLLDFQFTRGLVIKYSKLTE